MSHTPGPWAVIANENLPKSMQVITVTDVAANARLIAAAPDLLEALRRILKYIEIAEDEMCPGDNRWPVNADRACAQSAIAKATSPEERTASPAP